MGIPGLRWDLLNQTRRSEGVGKLFGFYLRGLHRRRPGQVRENAYHKGHWESYNRNLHLLATLWAVTKGICSGVGGS